MVGKPSWTSRELWLVASVAALIGGCDGCLGLDDYRLVPSDFVLPGTGAWFGTGGFGGAGGGDGGSGAGDVCESDASGSLYVTAAVAAGETRAGSCLEPASADGGIEIVQLSSVDGSCEAHARIEHSAGANSTVVCAGTSHRRRAPVCGGELPRRHVVAAVVHRWWRRLGQRRARRERQHVRHPAQ